MKRIITAVLLSVSLLLSLGSCSETMLDGTPKDKINPITDALFNEPEFAPLFITRLLYEQLSQTEQLFYRHFYNSVFSHPEYIAVPSGLSEETVQRVFISIKYDNPHILCLKNSYKTLTYGKLLFIRPDYTCSSKACAEKTQRLYTKARELTGEAKTLADDFERELYLHDALLEVCKYDSSDSGANAYDALISGKSSCGGYAMGMKLLLDYAGIPCGAVSGKAGTDGEFSPHMWLCVNIGNEWYHLDPTWNDPVGTVQKSTGHAWFNVTDGEISETHRDYTLPKEVTCEKTRFNYHTRKKLLCNGKNMPSVIQRALKQSFDGKTGIAEIKYNSTEEMKASIKELFTDGAIRTYAQTAGYPEKTPITYTSTDSINVLYIYI